MKGRISSEVFGLPSIRAAASIDWLMGVREEEPWAPWVAELSPGHPEPRREYLPWSLDYKLANSKGTRGVRASWIVESGKVYEVRIKTSWRSSDHYFATVDPRDGSVRRISREVALACLENADSA